MIDFQKELITAIPMKIDFNFYNWMCNIFHPLFEI